MKYTFFNYLEGHGIVHQTNCVNTAAQNRISEWKNRHLLEVIHYLIFTMNVSKSYWGDAVLSAAYLINRMPLKTLNFKSPLQIIQGTTSYLLPPKVFGCVCFIHRHHTGKLDFRILKCVFIGYSTTKKDYKCYHSLSYYNHTFFNSLVSPDFHFFFLPMYTWVLEVPDLFNHKSYALLN